MALFVSYFLESNTAESSSINHNAFSRNTLAGKDMAVSLVSKARTIASALPKGALVLLPAHAMTLLLLANMVANDNEIFTGCKILTFIHNGQ